jgi:hypothetical protein
MPDGGYFFPQFNYRETPLAEKKGTSAARPKNKATPKRATPQVRSAGIPADRPRSMSPEQWVFTNDGRKSVNRAAVDAQRYVRETYSDLPRGWQNAMIQSQLRRRVEQSIRRANYDTPQAYVGRTISNAAEFGKKVVIGMPQAMVEGAYLAARGAQAIGLAPSRNVREQVDAGREVVQKGVVEPVVDYYYPLAKQFVTDPRRTIEERGAELALMGALALSGGGQGVAAAGRGAGRVAQRTQAIRQGGGIRAGARIYRGQRRALNAQQLRDLQLRNLRDTASGGRSAEAPLAFRSSAQADEMARRGAQITGNVTANTAERAMGRMADMGSRSALPGSARYREPRIVEQQVPNNPAQRIEVPRRPRSTNPLMRGIQRAVTEPVGETVRGKIDQRLAKYARLASVLSSFSVATNRGGRKMGDEVKATTDAGVYEEGRALAKLVSRIKGAGRRGALPTSEVDRGFTAAIIRAMGAAEDLGGRRTWGRDEMVSRLNAYLEDPSKSGELSRRQKRPVIDQLETLKSIPDEWLDPTTSPKWLNDLEGEVRSVLRKSTDIKREIGAISKDTSEWGGRRAQAQFGFGGEPLSKVVNRAYAQPRRDLRVAKDIADELRLRAKNQGSTRFAGYSTEALQTIERNLRQRASTIRGRNAPFVAQARQDALSAFDEDNALRGEVEAARSRVRELESRPDTAEIRAQIAEARAEYTRVANFLAQRARERQVMANQGARAMDQAAAGRVDRDPGRRQTREDLEFDVQRASARVQMARQGRRALAGARARRAQTTITAGRSRQRGVTPTIAVPTGAVFAAGTRKGRAQMREGQARYGTMLRADGRLYVVNQNARRRQEAARDRAAENDRARREEIEPGIREQERARASRRQLTDAERRARADLDAARAELRRFNQAQARRPRKTEAQRRADRDVVQSRVPRKKAVPPEAKAFYDRIKELQAALAAARASRNGTPGQIAAARRQLQSAQRNLARARERYLRYAYTSARAPERAGMAPGEYYPQQSPVPGSGDTRFNTLVTGTFADDIGGEFAARSGASLSPRQEQFNAAQLADDGLILFSPRVVIDALRSALDAKARAEIASAFITKYAYHAPDGTPVSGDEAADIVRKSRGAYTLISTKQLARISSLSTDSIGGMELKRLLDEMPGGVGDEMVAVPTAAIRGWRTALDPGGPGGRLVDYVQSLWKGGILALNPRWYFQNFFGMWGQFALGAGADLQAISMATNPKYLNAIPGRISQMGLSQEFGEYARRASGDATNWLGSLIRAGYFGNSRLESVPRRAMYWHAAKKGLDQNQLFRGGVMDDGLLAAAWLDVARAAGRGDRGANQIVDQALLETERFMGNYSTYNWAERTILKRVFPFYAWMRAINRLAFALPAKHPKRAALLATASYMAYDERNDLTGYQQGIWLRDSTQLGMTTLIPFFSVMPTLDAAAIFGQDVETGDFADSGSAVVRTGLRLATQAGPVISEPFKSLTGETLQGVPEAFPEGYQGFRTQFGTGEYVRTNPTTGEREYGPPNTPLLRQLEGLIPFTAMARNILSGGMAPYATTGLPGLLKYRAREAFGADTDYERSQLFRPARPSDNIRRRSNFGYLTQGFAGVPIDRYNPDFLAAREASETKNYFGRIKSTAISQRKPRRNP